MIFPTFPSEICSFSAPTVPTFRISPHFVEFFNVWNTFGWFGLYEIIPGFFLALLAIVVFSLIGQKPSQAMKDIFDEVQTSVREERDLS